MKRSTLPGTTAIGSMAKRVMPATKGIAVGGPSARQLERPDNNQPLSKQSRVLIPAPPGIGVNQNKR
jgi:hypothetical protein